jgi:hypothetical protein
MAELDKKAVETAVEVARLRGAKHYAFMSSFRRYVVRMAPRT